MKIDLQDPEEVKASLMWIVEMYEKAKRTDNVTAVTCTHILARNPWLARAVSPHMNCPIEVLGGKIKIDEPEGG